MIAPGGEWPLRIEKPAAGGAMIARHDGQVILVSGAIPGEEVRARIDRVAHGVGHARAVEVLTPDADRRAPPERSDCGGNVYAHIAYPRQLALKGEILADAFARIGRIVLGTPVTVAPSPEQGYRMRARLHVRERRVGFFRSGTHDLCDAGSSGQLLPQTSRAIAHLGHELERLRFDAPADVELAENKSADRRALHFELEAERDGERIGGIADLPGLTGVSWSAPRRPHTAIVRGSPYVLDEVEIAHLPGPAGSGPARAGARLRRHVRSFFQGNRYLLEALVAAVLAKAPEGAVTDLYAGVGLFAVALAAAGRAPVVAVEGDRLGAADLEENAAPYRGTMRVLRMGVEEYLLGRPVSPAATLIVDPPRTGMSREAVAAIGASGAGRIVYVSCDVATLARDARKLVEAGYRVKEIEGFDMFPNTAHVESVVVFER